MKFSELPMHHALLLTHPNRTVYADNLWKELQAQSPAHRFFNQTVLDIDTARDMIAFAQSPLSVEKIALVSFHTASIPAQNALLKVLEEPRDKARFILVTSHTSHLITTVLSRTFHVALHNDTRSDTASQFLQTAPSARIKLPFVTQLLQAEDEEGRKDREEVKRFILSLADVLQTSSHTSRYVKETLEMAAYASDPSSSGKALIEYLALLLPVIK